MIFLYVRRSGRTEPQRWVEDPPVGSSSSIVHAVVPGSKHVLAPDEEQLTLAQLAARYPPPAEKEDKAA